VIVDLEPVQIVRMATDPNNYAPSLPSSPAPIPGEIAVVHYGGRPCARE
jgi:hypothetical protein